MGSVRAAADDSPMRAAEAGIWRHPPFLLGLQFVGHVYGAGKKLEIQRRGNSDDCGGMPKLAFSGAITFVVTAQFNEHQ
jgi:hypothetical protein